MSEKRTTIENTGVESADLTINSFWGEDKKGKMIQLSQGSGGSAVLKPLDKDEPGYIQLTKRDAYYVIIELTKWLKEVSNNRATQMAREIEKNKELQKTILKEAVTCERFIAELKILEIPVRLLSETW